MGIKNFIGPVSIGVIVGGLLSYGLYVGMKHDSKKRAEDIFVNHYQTLGNGGMFAHKDPEIMQRNSFIENGDMYGLALFDLAKDFERISESDLRELAESD